MIFYSILFAILFVFEFGAYPSMRYHLLVAYRKVSNCAMQKCAMMSKDSPEIFRQKNNQFLIKFYRPLVIIDMIFLKTNLM